MNLFTMDRMIFVVSYFFIWFQLVYTLLLLTLFSTCLLTILLSLWATILIRVHQTILRWLPFIPVAYQRFMNKPSYARTIWMYGILQPLSIIVFWIELGQRRYMITFLIRLRQRRYMIAVPYIFMRLNAWLGNRRNQRITQYIHMVYITYRLTSLSSADPMASIAPNFFILKQHIANLSSVLMVACMLTDSLLSLQIILVTIYQWIYILSIPVNYQRFMNRPSYARTIWMYGFLLPLSIIEFLVELGQRRGILAVSYIFMRCIAWIRNNRQNQLIPLFIRANNRAGGRDD